MDDPLIIDRDDGGVLIIRCKRQLSAERVRSLSARLHAAQPLRAIVLDADFEMSFIPADHAAANAAYSARYGDIA